MTNSDVRAVEAVDLETYAIGLLAEESAEVIQMAGKWLRFGPDHSRKDGLTARRGLSLEAGDALAAIDYGIAAGILDRTIVEWQRAKKYGRLTDANAVDDEGRRLAPEVPADPSPPAMDREAVARKRVGAFLVAISEEAVAANNVISLNRDGQGQGRIRVATAMHRIARLAAEAIALAGTGGGVPEGGEATNDDCPCCGSHKIKSIKGDDKIHPYHIVCESCGIRTANHGVSRPFTVRSRP